MAYIIGRHWCRHILTKKNLDEQYKNIDRNNTTNLSGIEKGVVKSLGTIDLDLKIGDFLVPHIFYIVHESFPIQCDGILGMDFITKYNCILDFHHGNHSFCIRPKNVHMDTVLLPATSEVIRQVLLTTSE